MSSCYEAHIALNPYEIPRLARSLQLSTTDFIARYLTDGGIVLRKIARRQAGDLFSSRTADISRYDRDDEFGLGRDHCLTALTARAPNRRLPLLR